MQKHWHFSEYQRWRINLECPTSAALNAVQRPLHRATFPSGPFSPRLNGCRTEKQLNSSFINENRCGFANSTFRELSRCIVIPYFNTLSHLFVPSSPSSSSPPPSSFSVKVSRIPKSAFARTHYSAEPLALKRETFTSLPAHRYFLPLPSLPHSFRRCRGPAASNGTKRHSDSLGEIKPRPMRYSETSHPGN